MSTESRSPMPMVETVEQVRALLTVNVTQKLEAHLRAQAEVRKEQAYKIGAWNVGACPRRNWLLLNGSYQEALQPRSLMVFDLGNRIEDAVLEYLIAAGVPLIRTNEKKDTVDFPPIGRIRPDAYLDIGGGIHVVVDVKSMSEKSFAKAVRGDVDFTYRAQVECYERAFETRFGVLLCYQKNTSHFDFTTNIFQQDDEVWAEVLRRYALSTGPTLPIQPYGLQSECSGVAEGKCVNGKTPVKGKPHTNCGGTGQEPGGPFLKYPCTYCPVREACWKEAGYEVVPIIEEKEAPRWAVRPVGVSAW